MCLLKVMRQLRRRHRQLFVAIIDLFTQISCMHVKISFVFITLTSKTHTDNWMVAANEMPVPVYYIQGRRRGECVAMLDSAYGFKTARKVSKMLWVVHTYLFVQMKIKMYRGQ